MDWIDDTERELIIKFFGIDPIGIVTPDSDDLYLGESDFYNVVEFYKFEFKPHEKPFWDILYPKLMALPNKSMPLIMSRVDVGYPWLDYVTDVKIRYLLIDDELRLVVPKNKDKYHNALTLICCMLFVSDFKEVDVDFYRINTDAAWARILEEAKQYE